jgi:hypothetical protein
VGRCLMLFINGHSLQVLDSNFEHEDDTLLCETCTIEESQDWFLQHECLSQKDIVEVVIDLMNRLSS